MNILRRTIKNRNLSLLINPFRRTLITLLRNQNSNKLIASNLSARNMIQIILNPHMRMNIIINRNNRATVLRNLRLLNLKVRLLRLGVQMLLDRRNLNNHTLNRNRLLTLRLVNTNSLNTIKKSRTSKRFRMQVNRISRLLTLINRNRINRRRISLIKLRQIRATVNIRLRPISFSTGILASLITRHRIVTNTNTIILRVTMKQRITRNNSAGLTNLLSLLSNLTLLEKKTTNDQVQTVTTDHSKG